MLDIDKNRRAAKYSKGEILQRVCWGTSALLFRNIPRPLFSLRNWLLRLHGSHIGQSVRITNTALIQYPWLLSIGDYSAIGECAIIYNLGQLTLGKRVTISQYAHLCGGTHNYRSASLELIRCPINVGDDAWVAAEAFVGPNVDIGSGAIIGARAVVVKNVPPWKIVAGNPARVIGERTIDDRDHGEK